MEEVGLYGAAAFDHERLDARIGYVYDQAAPIGEVILGAPYSHSMNVKLRGRAAHSGMFPEEGRSAIAAAAKAIADFKLGRVDDETTANVGVIEGGTAGNIIPEHCSFLADVRAHDPKKLADLVREMLESITFAASLEDCQVETEVHKSYNGYRFKRDDDVVRIASSALERSGFEPSFPLSGGGADANVFNERGLACVNLANGMVDIHTPDERIAVSDLERMVDVTLALVDVARETHAA
jgi:tripeptide aminopeptidase